MSNSYVRWDDLRAEHVARAGGEDPVDAGKQDLLNELVEHRLAEVGAPRHERAAGAAQRCVGATLPRTA